MNHTPTNKIDIANQTGFDLRSWYHNLRVSEVVETANTIVAKAGLEGLKGGKLISPVNSENMTLLFEDLSDEVKAKLHEDESFDILEAGNLTLLRADTVELAKRNKRKAKKKAEKNKNAREVRRSDDVKQLRLRNLTDDQGIKIVKKLFTEYVESDDYSTFMQFLYALDNEITEQRLALGIEQAPKLSDDDDGDEGEDTAIDD